MKLFPLLLYCVLALSIGSVGSVCLSQTLGSSPLSPSSWALVPTDLLRVLQALVKEMSEGYPLDANGWGFSNNLPTTIFLTLIGLLLIFRSRSSVISAFQTFDSKIELNEALRRLSTFLSSFLVSFLPVVGFYILLLAVESSRLGGELGILLMSILVWAAGITYAVRWLVNQIFSSNGHRNGSILKLDSEKQQTSILSIISLGLLYSANRGVLLLGLEGFLRPGSVAVLNFLIVIAVGIFLFRLMKTILTGIVSGNSSENVTSENTNSLAVFVLRLGMAASVIGPILLAVGYSELGNAVVVSSVLTIGLLATGFVVQRVFIDLLTLLIGESAAFGGLLPSIFGIIIAMLYVPILGLIWGAGLSDLVDTWLIISNGFQLGDSKITPLDFFKFLIIFAVGYSLTRVLQNSLKTQILPKTNIDTGGKNALTAGAGYVGIFLAAVIAISTAGVDLSSLAIVAGALSVGIGFGLQNIVSNFVSGIILLVERPISEGDWIEVNGTMGVVKNISVRATSLQTFDRRDVIVPNSDLISGAVTNWTRTDLTGRIIISIGVAYGTDTRRVTEILEEVVLGHPLVSDRNPPSIYFTNFGADALEFEIKIILEDVNFSLSTKSEINHRIAERFTLEGIEVPYAQRDIWLRNPEALTGKPTEKKPKLRASSKAAAKERAARIEKEKATGMKGIDSGDE